MTEWQHESDLKSGIPRELRDVRYGESETVEFKKSTGQLRRACETLCGMLNGEGGRVFIGITPEGKIAGQEIADKTHQEIADMLRRFTPPTQITRQSIMVKGGKKVLVLSVGTHPELRPFVFDGRPYQRIGTTTSIMPQEVYQRLLNERSHSHARWEILPVKNCKITDLDENEILKTIRLGISAGRLPESSINHVPDILQRLGLTKDGVVLNAAVVLFGKHLTLDFPQCQLRMAHFKGVDKTSFLDQAQVDGHAFELLDTAMLFLRRNLPVAGRIVPGLFEREDEPLFPPEALREALVNAFCHRDYRNAGGAVSLAIYDDRLEIWNDGILPFGLKPEDLKRDHPSKPRNPLIAKIFYLRGMIERWGRGTQKIVQLCVQAGHPEPQFGEQAGAVWVRFLPSGYIAPHRISHDLTERQRELLQILSGHSPMPVRSIREYLKNPPADRTLRDDLAHLKRLNLISSSGHGRGATWKLTNKAE